LRLRVPGWHQEIDVAKYAPARLVEDEVTQRLIFGDEVPLLPQVLPGWRSDSADDYVSDLALGMA